MKEAERERKGVGLTFIGLTDNTFKKTMMKRWHHQNKRQRGQRKGFGPFMAPRGAFSGRTGFAQSVGMAFFLPCTKTGSHAGSVNILNS